jgi:hypothetical protein
MVPDNTTFAFVNWHIGSICKVALLICGIGLIHTTRGIVGTILVQIPNEDALTIFKMVTV